jgi:hypothetical protein
VSGPLPRPMLDGTGQGLVTRSWQELLACFAGGPQSLQPHLDDGERAVTFPFRRLPLVTP